MWMNKRGITLMEIIVGVVLSTIVATGVFRTVLSTQRNSQALTQRLDVQQTVRSAVHYLGVTLRELDASDGDLITLTNNTLRFRGMSWVGFMCGPAVKAGADVILPVRESVFYGTQRPDANLDSVLVFREGDPATKKDDRWLPAGLRNIAVGVCTDATVASLLRISVAASQGGADSVLVGVTDGAPVRGFQITELSATTGGDGSLWLGRRTANNSGTWTSMVPIVGPIASGGFDIRYFDSAGNVTGTAADVSSLQLIIRGRSLDPVTGPSGGYIHDSLVTRVSLRNNRRF